MLRSFQANSTLPPWLSPRALHQSRQGVKVIPDTIFSQTADCVFSCSAADSVFPPQRIHILKQPNTEYVFRLFCFQKTEEDLPVIYCGDSRTGNMDWWHQHDSLLSRWTYNAKIEHRVVNFIPELRLSCLAVCVEVTKPETNSSWSTWLYCWSMTWKSLHLCSWTWLRWDVRTGLGSLLEYSQHGQQLLSTLYNF